MQRSAQNLTPTENPLGEIARILGFSAVARSAGVCQQSVSKWSRAGVGRESTDRVITASVVSIAQQVSDLLGQYNSRTTPAQADAQTVTNFADVDA